MEEKTCLLFWGLYIKNVDLNYSQNCTVALCDDSFDLSDLSGYRLFNIRRYMPKSFDVKREKKNLREDPTFFAPLTSTILQKA